MSGSDADHRLIKNPATFLRAGLVILAVAILPISFNACQGGKHMDLPQRTGEELDASLCGPGAEGGGGLAPTPNSEVTYEQVVKPQVFQKVCAECHGKVAGLPNWLNYEQAYLKRDLIRTRVSNLTMPPANATINRLTEAEIQLVQKWIDGGAPRGTLAAPGPTQGDCAPATGGSPETGTPGGEPAPAEPLDPPPPDRPTYVGHLKPQIFKPICGSCHGVQPDLPNWQEYEEASDRAEKIKRRIQDGEMPPPSSGISLTPNQKALIIKWVDLGAPYE